MKKLSLVLLSLMLLGCGNKPINQNFAKLLKAKKYTVAMFIAPDCPLCKTLSTPFSELSERYPDIQFLAVYSGTHYEPMELNMYATETKLMPRIFRDYYYEVAGQLGASVTPEFFLLDSSANILYQGMMDDRIIDLGSYKQTWDKLYLNDAIQAIVSDKTPPIKKTQPIGCVLEY
ncbi:thioredoxin fold domain-containing protein [Bacteroidia bacterium]|nr:thioredoxin fold domain-containing protein [Bacteroidia bacterium]MDB4106868.1 thioredoxin fold domain-containing protein [Bacteroidia bacterium]MDB9882577.1 thioredoxin fold domain-containing protein [Bacteroidia bacterium]